MNTTETIMGIGGLCLIFAFIFALGLAIGDSLGEARVQGAAIQQGVAEWRCDAKTGRTAFTWMGEKK